MQQNYKSVDCQISPVIIFLAQYPDGTAKAPRHEPFEAECLKRNQNCFLNPPPPQGMMGTLSILYGSPHPPPPPPWDLAW